MFWRPCSIFNKQRRARAADRRPDTGRLPRRGAGAVVPRYPRRFRGFPPPRLAHGARAPGSFARLARDVAAPRALARRRARRVSRARVGRRRSRASSPASSPSPSRPALLPPGPPSSLLLLRALALVAQARGRGVRRPPPRGAAHDPAQARGEVRPRRAHQRRHRVRLPERRARRPRGLRRVPRRGQRGDGRARPRHDAPHHARRDAHALPRGRSRRRAPPPRRRPPVRLLRAEPRARGGVRDAASEGGGHGRGEARGRGAASRPTPPGRSSTPASL